MKIQLKATGHFWKRCRERNIHGGKFLRNCRLKYNYKKNRIVAIDGFLRAPVTSVPDGSLFTGYIVPTIYKDNTLLKKTDRYQTI